MANHRDGNVIYVDTDDTLLADVKSVVAVKYLGSSGGSANIKGLDSGRILWQAAGTSDLFEEPTIEVGGGIEVEVESGAAILIYARAR